MSQETAKADKIGIVSHWLASEYVVLEGWKQLNEKDSKIDKLIALYPEHCEALRRCHNAVYHFQTEPLDDRIGRCLENKNEELSWSVVLHYEFQRFLLNYAYVNLDGTLAEKEQTAQLLNRCIGWFPTEVVSAEVLKLYKKAVEFSALVDDDISPLGIESKKFIASVLEQVKNFEGEPLFYKLKRVRIEEHTACSDGPVLDRIGSGDR